MKVEEIIYDCILQLRDLTTEHRLHVLAPTDRARVVISSSKTICTLLTLQLAYQEALKGHPDKTTPPDREDKK